MNASKRKLAVVSALLLVFFLSCYAAIHLLARSERLRARIESELSERSGYEVRIDALRLSPGLSLILSGVSVSKEGQVLFQGKRIVCSFLRVDVFYGRISRVSLEKPTFRFSLQDFLNSSGEISPNVSLGALNIADGEFVLETGYGEPFAVRSVFLNVMGVGIGSQAGLQFRAYLPAVNGNAALSISGEPGEKHLEIVIRQGEEKRPARLLPTLLQEKSVFEARFQIKSNESQIYEIKGSGAAHEFQLGSERVEGQFDSLFELDAKLTNLLLLREPSGPRSEVITPVCEKL
ncbi:MAG: hypothetical protein HYV04_01275 [Deltaproteobacteria bacterium]|nr:hypothetical protein [Deltaproteobacteria bacterium]